MNEKKSYSWVFLVLGILSFVAVGILLIMKWSGGIRVASLPFALAGVLCLAYWHSLVTYYECEACGHIFQASFTTDLFSPHSFDKKRLKCPNCNNKSWKKQI